MVHALKSYEFGELGWVILNKYSCRKFVKYNSRSRIISIIGISTKLFKLMSLVYKQKLTIIGQ